MKGEKKQLPPGPRSWVPWRVFRELRRDPLAFFTKLTREYGDVSSFWAMGQRYVVLNHPDIVREVLLTQADAFWKGPALQNSKGILGEGLLTAEGEAHRQQRKLMQPAFHAKHVESYAPVVIESTRAQIGRWQKEVADRGGKVTVDIRPGMMGLTLVIAGETLFGARMEGQVERVHACMNALMKGYVRAVVPWGRLLNRLPLASTRRLGKARGELHAVVQEIIAARRAEIETQVKESNTDMLSGGAGAQAKSGCPFAAEHGTRAPAHGAVAVPKRTDLLSMMIAATDNEGGDGRMRLTDVQLRDQAITILTAGHETTANALTFTLYLLAKHPEEQRLLREEIQAVVGDGEPTVEMMDRLVRTRWVLSESMRLLPPAWTLGRQNQREVELGGYRIPAKTTVLIPQWTLHQDPRFWEKPEAFLPERWRNPTHPRFAYIPFSTGPRNCIGESFAWLEMMLALPMLVKDFAYSLPENSPPLRLVPAITLRPRDPVMLSLQLT